MRPRFAAWLPPFVFLLCAVAPTGGASQSGQSRWWMDEPIRFLQTNLSETDSTVDPKTLVDAVAGFGANTFLMNMGGIVAQYPTRVPFHYPSVHLPARSEEHTSELQSRLHLVCRLLLEKKKINKNRLPL